LASIEKITMAGIRDGGFTFPNLEWKFFFWKFGEALVRKMREEENVVLGVYSVKGSKGKK